MVVFSGVSLLSPEQLRIHLSRLRTGYPKTQREEAIDRAYYMRGVASRIFLFTSVLSLMTIILGVYQLSTGRISDELGFGVLPIIWAVLSFRDIRKYSRFIKLYGWHLSRVWPFPSSFYSGWLWLSSESLDFIKRLGFGREFFSFAWLRWISFSGSGRSVSGS